MMPARHFSALLTAGCLAAFQAGAQTPASDTLSAIPDQQLQPVEVRSLRIGARAPFAATELKARELERMNLGQDLPVLLQYTPSAVTTTDAGAGIGYTGLRIRGTDGSRINVTLNGIPVNDAESHGTFFVNLPDLATSTSSIQLQRGVGSSTNGASAFGATMSISNLAQMEQAGFEAQLGLGSFNTSRVSLRAGTGLLRGGFQFDVRLSAIQSDGYIQRSASELQSLQILGGWKATEKTSFRMMVLRGSERTGQAWNGVPEDSLRTNRTYNELGLRPDGTYYNNQTDNYRQDYYQFFTDHKFSNRLSAHLGLFLTRGKGYYEDYKQKRKFGDYGMTNPVIGGDTLQTTDLVRQLWLDNKHYGAVFSLLYELPRTSLSAGGALTRYDGDHYGEVIWARYGFPDHHRWYDNDARKNDANVYLKAEHRLGRALALFGDLQLRHITYTVNGFRDNPTLRPDVAYTFFNPKAGISHTTLRPGGRNKAYASVAVAHKEPNRDDFEVATTSLPRPERLYDAEAGYELGRRSWSASANVYYMYYIDQLVLTGQINDVGAYTRTNVPESYRAGLELQGAWKPASWTSLSANATFSRNRIVAFTEYMDDYDQGGQQLVSHKGTDLAFSPATIAAATWTIAPFRKLGRGQQLELDILGKYVGRQYLDNTSNEDRSIKAYGLADLRIRYSLAVKPFREAAFTLALNNVLDRRYESNGYTFSYVYGGRTTTQNYYYPQAGFNWLAGLSLKW